MVSAMSDPVMAKQPQGHQRPWYLAYAKPKALSKTSCNWEAVACVYKVQLGPSPLRHLEWKMDNGLPTAGPPKNISDGSS